MELTKFSDYSLRMLLYLGLNPDRVVSLVEIADAYSISRNHLVKISNHLAKLGLVQATRGKGGGLQLSKAPEDINIGSVVRSTEGHSPLVECFDPESNTCCIIKSCALKGVLKKAERAFYSELDQHSLQNLLRNRKGLKLALAKD
ncbi:Rrf2 family transcriptional regulator [Pelagicoccus sp. NFK12]|uniref:Rrf2 family transcriptional regulator n=1 Tax=Pelagicoccus enzymogenes TaxID=2773457 RepID=A0A927F9X3_9BACT|nr:Rrf2 family transcriptional regulator [Pelagicoccus enzymogenes]MBD5779598.1 Rrf2 family transcriptional regulator [Pelagicoccus enzymogenes]MDQ8200444.1 Rrf2 family transcriptional regulator [Pelagicoccus enzymogenes]